MLYKLVSKQIQTDGAGKISVFGRASIRQGRAKEDLEEDPK